jgi:hypothetical protein
MKTNLNSCLKLKDGMCSMTDRIVRNASSCLCMVRGANIDDHHGEPMSDLLPVVHLDRGRTRCRRQRIDIPDSVIQRFLLCLAPVSEDWRANVEEKDTLY